MRIRQVFVKPWTFIKRKRLHCNEEVIMAMKVSLKMFGDREHACAVRFASKQMGSMAEVFDIIVTYRPKFDDEDWYGHKGESISGTRANEVIALLRSKGGYISIKTVGKVHKQVEKLVGGKDEIEIDMTGAKAMLKKINAGDVLISHLINGVPPRNGASAQRGPSVSRCMKLALEMKDKTPEQILSMNGASDLFNQLKRAFPK